MSVFFSLSYVLTNTKHPKNTKFGLLEKFAPPKAEIRICWAQISALLIAILIFGGANFSKSPTYVFLGCFVLVRTQLNDKKTDIQILMILPCTAYP